MAEANTLVPPPPSGIDKTLRTASILMWLGRQALERRIAAGSMTTEEALAAAESEWREAENAAAELRLLGHPQD
jgi:hypothetical protein